MKSTLKYFNTLNFKPFKEAECVITSHSSQEVSDKNWFVFILYLPKEELTGGFWKNQLEHLLQQFSEPVDDFSIHKMISPEEKYFPEDDFVSIIQSSPIDYLFQTFYCFSNTLRVFISELQYLNENCIDFQLQSL